MNGKQHLVIGAACGLATGIVLNKLNSANVEGLMGAAKAVATVAVCTGVGAVGGLIPDIDSKKSKGSQAVNSIMMNLIWMLVGAVVIGGSTPKLLMSNTARGAMGNLIITALVILITMGKMSPHRQFTHKILGTVFICACVMFIAPMVVGVSFTAGYISHIIADMTTEAGLRFFDIKLPLQKEDGNFCFHF